MNLRRLALVVLAAALVVAGLLRGPADAASPASGSVDPASPQATWTGGPFVAPNVTAQVGDPVCDVPTSCDDYKLHVSAGSRYADDHQLKVRVGWQNTAADFDIYLLDDAGNVVSSAASSADPETMIVPPNTGDYTVRVVPFAPLGESYSATAALVDTPANPAPGTATRPRFANYAAPKKLTGANDAGEPSIGTNWKSDSTLYQAGLSTFRVRFDDSTSPATAHWKDVSANITNGCPQGSTTSLDPILFTDHTTGRTFESQLTGVDSFTCATDNDGKAWLPTQGGGIPSGVDHQTIGGGPFSDQGLGALPTSTYPHAVYYCSQDIATAFCAVSRDGGTTFGPGVPTYNLMDCGGLHGHVKVGPDGTAYLPNKGCGNNAAVVVSRDNGASWTVRKVPGSTVGDSDPSVGVGANGALYFGWVGADGKPGVAVSLDHGQTWKHQQLVGTEYGIKNAVFPVMVAGDDDRAAFAYLGTPRDGNYQNIKKFHGVWHLYVTTTYDRGRTWQTIDATPKDPVQRGSICTGGTTCGNDRNLLDFNDITIDDHGRIEVGYADGCTGTCVNGGKNTRTAYATIARQRSGRPLFSAFDPVQRNVRLSSLSVAPTRHGLHATVGVRNTGRRTLDGIRLLLQDNGDRVVLTGTHRIRPGHTWTYDVSWRTGSGEHQVTAVADPRNRVREGDEGDNKRTRRVTR